MKYSKGLWMIHGLKLVWKQTSKSLISAWKQTIQKTKVRQDIEREISSKSKSKSKYLFFMLIWKKRLWGTAKILGNLPEEL